MKFTSRKGFTLVELFVVIGIMGVLMAIVISNVTTSRVKARDNKRISDLKQLHLALEQFFDACNAFPTSLSESASAAGCSYTLGQYLSQIPTDPSTNASYAYSIANYCIGTTLENPANANSIGDGSTCDSGGTGNNYKLNLR